MALKLPFLAACVTPTRVGGPGSTFVVRLAAGLLEANGLSPSFEEHQRTESPTNIVFLPEPELVHLQPVNTDPFRVTNDPDTQIHFLGDFVADNANMLPASPARSGLSRAIF